MQQREQLNYNKYDGFFHYHTLNKKLNRMTFLASKRSSEVENFEENLVVNPNLDYYKSKSNYSAAKKGTLLGMTKIVIDIDAHRTKDINQKNIINILTHSLMNERHDINFSEIIETGRGIQVYINIEQTSHVLSWLYEKASRYQAERFVKVINDIKDKYVINEEIEVDITATISPKTLIRVPGTYNSVNQVQTKTVYKNNLVYQLNDLLEEKVKCEFIMSNFTCDTFEKNLINSRINFLLSDDHVIEVGNRMKTLFLLYNNLVQIKNIKDAKDEVYRFNRNLKKPIKSNELESMFKYIDAKGFLKFKTSTFREWIGAEHIKTKRDREEENRVKRELKDKQIRALLTDKTITYKQIAERMEVDVKTVMRHAKKLGLNRYK